jgi:hypothetical protein
VSRHRLASPNSGLPRPLRREHSDIPPDPMRTGTSRVARHSVRYTNEEEKMLCQKCVHDDNWSDEDLCNNVKLEVVI